VFDLSRITDMIGGFIGQTAAGAGVKDLVADKLAAVNIDPAMLEGLAAPEIVDLLARNGIDVTQLAPEQLAELASTIDPSSPIGQALSSLLSDRGGRT